MSSLIGEYVIYIYIFRILRCSMCCFQGFLSDARIPFSLWKTHFHTTARPVDNGTWQYPSWRKRRPPSGVFPWEVDQPWNLKIFVPWKRRVLLETIILKFQPKFRKGTFVCFCVCVFVWYFLGGWGFDLLVGKQEGHECMHIRGCSVFPSKKMVLKY